MYKQEEKLTCMEWKKEHWIIFLIQITEVLGFSLILPFLPFFAQELGASPIIIGLLIVTFSFFQFFSAPIMGRLSDIYGRKPLLIISQIATFFGFLILGFANTLFLVFLSRIVDGLLGSNFTITQAYLSDISSKKDRSKLFGIGGAAFGIGFLIGPGLGGYLSQFGYSLPSFIAAGTVIVTIIITWLFLPETIKRKKKIKFDLKIFDVLQFVKYLKNKKLALKIWPYFTYLMAHIVFVSMFALYAERQLGAGTAFVGLILTYLGINAIILRGIMLPKLIDFFGEKKLKFISVISMMIALVMLSFSTSNLMFFISITMFAFGGGTTRPLMVGSISRGVSSKEQGAILGLTNSLASVTQMIGPLIGGFMLNYFFPGSVTLVAAGIMFFGLIMMLLNNK